MPKEKPADRNSKEEILRDIEFLKDIESSLQERMIDDALTLLSDWRHELQAIIPE